MAVLVRDPSATTPVDVSLEHNRRAYYLSRTAPQSHLRSEISEHSAGAAPARCGQGPPEPGRPVSIAAAAWAVKPSAQALSPQWASGAG